MMPRQVADGHPLGTIQAYHRRSVHSKPLTHVSGLKKPIPLHVLHAKLYHFN
jgi:hypothetical protein